MPTATSKQIDETILAAIKNPTDEAYEIKLELPECTFLGVKEQPDFADIYLIFYPNKRVIELKSLKQYVFQLRNIVVSYERLINIMYDHLMSVYEPHRLRLVMVCNPRGGISSRLTIYPFFVPFFLRAECSIAGRQPGPSAEKQHTGHDEFW